MSLNVLNKTARKWLLMVVVVLSVAFLYKHRTHSKKVIYKFHRNIMNKIEYYQPSKEEVTDPLTLAKKWVVITSIFEPTQSVKMISKMKDWKLVVVGDMKTPSNWSWPNVVYIGVEEQKSLGFGISENIEWNSFARKAFGYLYAMKHGAEYIYETDDDNVPMGDLQTFQQDIPYRLTLTKTTQNAYNPHLHFGQSSTWPRGYPLDKIGLPINSIYSLCPTRQPDVVQGLVNGDPDIDAIFRLTRRFPLERIDIKFDEKAPLFLYPPGVYTPYNCQNTLFRRSAFWSTILPISVSFRATDIFRAYWAEKLMELAGQSLAFSSATFYQLRSPHNLLGDMKLEIHVYLDNFVKLIDNWTCTSVMFSECMLELTREIVNEGYYEESDYEFLEVWIEDLRKIDASLVDFETMEPQKNCNEGEGWKVIFFPHEQLTTMPHDPRLTRPAFVSNREAILDNYMQQCHNNYSNYLISLDAQHKLYEDFLLVVQLKADVENNIIFFLTYYKLYFNHIVFCSEAEPDNKFVQKWKSSMILFKKGSLTSMTCVSAATKMDYNVTGSFFMTDDMMFNVQTKNIINYSQPWLPKPKFYSENECKDKKCVSIDRSTLIKLSVHLNNDTKPSNKSEDITDTMFDPRCSSTLTRLISVVKELLKEKYEVLRLDADLSAYLQKKEALTIYRVEKILNKKLLRTPQIIQILLHSMLYSPVATLNSDPNNSEFSSMFGCNSRKPACVCEHLNK